jgi:hypothetical protein
MVLNLPSRAFFSQVGEAAQTLILGGNYTIHLQKGKKKLNVNSILGENCMILKNFSLGKQPFTGPYYRWKKGPAFIITNFYMKCTFMVVDEAIDTCT